MKKRLLFTIATTFLVASQSVAYNETMAKTVKGDYAGKADSLATVLIDQFMNVEKGTFWSTPKDVKRESAYIYWQQAHAMDVLVYAYERHKENGSSTLARKYKNYMQLWYQNKANNYSGSSSGYKMFENPYTDDMLWICLTLMHMTEATGSSTYATAAKNLYDNVIMARLKEDNRGKWLPWNTDANSGPNSCTEGPACLLSVKLYEKYGTEKYLENAVMFYEFMVKYQCKDDGRCEEPPLTYTQGTFGEACRRLYHVTNQSVYKTKANLYINYAFTSGRCTNGANILRNEGTSMDQSIFKAVLIPYAVNFVLDESMPLATRKNISTYIQKNANTLWSVLDKDKYASKTMYCPYDWTKPWDYTQTASMGAMASGASLLENCARMCIALTTKPEEDAIEDVSLSSEQDENEAVYTLDGRLLQNNGNMSALKKGLYIMGNKKILVP